MKETVEKLVKWINGCVRSASMSGAVFGMSGGIDSAVVAVLCKKAFPEKCLGLIMPCYSVATDQKHAENIAHQFDIPVNIINLNNVFDTFIRTLGHDPTELRSKQQLGMAFANIKSRLRMITLYYFARTCDYLVVGSGNKSEIAVGYFTKWGDAGVDILPLGNLVKRDVVDLARFLGIPQEIIAKPPSAGLWEGQTDEAELGMSYKELDAYLTGGEYSQSIKEKTDKLININMHKRRLPLIPE